MLTSFCRDGYPSEHDVYIFILVNIYQSGIITVNKIKTILCLVVLTEVFAWRYILSVLSAQIIK